MITIRIAPEVVLVYRNRVSVEARWNGRAIVGKTLIDGVLHLTWDVRPAHGEADLALEIENETVETAAIVAVKDMFPGACISWTGLQFDGYVVVEFEPKEGV